jgi:hypothetical protein
MKGKVAIIFLVTLLLTLALAPQAKAQPSLQVIGYTDKTQYKPGDSGTVNLWIRNTQPVVAYLWNVSVIFAWYIGGSSNGNWTTVLSTPYPAIGMSQNWTTSISFTVPNDGRAGNSNPVAAGHGQNIAVIVGYIWYETGTPPPKHTPEITGWLTMNIAAAPFNAVLWGFDMLQTLFIVNIIVMIIAAVIIAYAVRSKGKAPPPP